jgi:hypothetical protein
VVTYDDGYVGPGFGQFDGNTPDGTSYGYISNAGQVTPTNRTDSFGNTIYNAAFHTDRTFYQNRYNPGSFHSSDDEVGVGPYVELRYALFQGVKADVNLTLGYSWVSAELGSGVGALATQTLTRVDEHRTYNYDFDAVAAGAVGAPFPFTDTGSFFITNAAGSYNDGNFLGPRQSVDRSSRTVAQYVLLGHADVDVDLHEIVLAPEFQLHLGDRVHLGVSVGPTVNFINSDLDATASWYRRGSSKALKTYQVHESTNDVELGVASQLTLLIDITSRLYIQASGSYRYVPDVDVAGGFAKASVDTAAWQGAVGLGIRL